MAKLPDARNCRHFWTLISSSCLKSANTHRHDAPGGRDPLNCRRFWTLISSSRLRSANTHRVEAPWSRDAGNCRCFWNLKSSSRFPAQVPRPPQNSGRIPDFPYPENSGKISDFQASFFILKIQETYQPGLFILKIQERSQIPKPLFSS